MREGAPPQTPLGELTVLPRPPSWILGGVLLRGRGRDERREGEEGREGEEKGKEGRGGGREGGGRVGPPSQSLPSRTIFLAPALIFGPDLADVYHLLCCFCLFHINYTSHQPQKKLNN